MSASTGQDLPTDVTVTVRYFASLREALGASETLVLPAGITDRKSVV